jgi:hypothetical protein
MLPLLKRCLQNLRQTLHGLEAGCVVLGILTLFENSIDRIVYVQIRVSFEHNSNLFLHRYLVDCRVPDGGDMSLVKSSFAFGLDVVAVVYRTAGISVMTEY